MSASGFSKKLNNISGITTKLADIRSYNYVLLKIEDYMLTLHLYFIDFNNSTFCSDALNK